MSITNQFVNMVNKAFNTKANQVVKDLRAACPKKTGATARSFRILSRNESMSVGTGGLVTGVTIGSTLKTAWFANYGNNQKYAYFGGRAHPGMPNYKGGKSGAKMLYYDGKMHLSSSTYEGTHFVEEVVAKWNG